MSSIEHEGGAPEGVTRQEFAGLTSAVEELRGAMVELREASTATERREARGDVRDARAELDTVARELGLDPKRLTAAAEKAKLEDERERLRPILVELLDEELTVTEEVEGAVEGVKEGVKAAAEAAAEVVEPPKPDTPPGGGSHWSERPLSSLFGG